MTRYSFVLLLLFLLLHDVQAQSWQWGRRIGGNWSDPNNIDPDEKIYDLTMDPSGNVYVCGRIANNANANGMALTTYNGYDIVVAKYNCEGDLAWIKVCGSSGVDIAYNLALDNLGHLYVSGRAYAIPSFPCQLFDTVITETTQDFFLAKLDTSGNRIWLKLAGPGNPTLNSAGKRIVIDPMGNLNMVVEVGDTGLLFPGYPILTEGVYIMKLDTAGNVLQRFLVSEGFAAAVMDFDIGPSGDYYTVSYFVQDSARIGNQSLYLHNNYGRREMVIAKFDSMGSFQWLDHRGDTVSLSQGFHLEVDALGDIYVEGSLSTGGDVFVYGNDTLRNAYSPLPSIEAFAFLVKYNSAGQSLWGVHTDNQYYTEGTGGISIRPNGDVVFLAVVRDTSAFGPFFVPIVYNKMLLCRVSSSGIPQGVDVFYSNTVAADYVPTCFVMDSTITHAYIGGAFKGNLDVNGTVHPFAGGYTDCMLIRYGNNCLVGLNELVSGPVNVSVYPNPARDAFFIQSLIPVERVELYNLIGARLYAHDNPAKSIQPIEIDVSRLPSGIYIMKMLTEKGAATERIVKQ